MIVTHQYNILICRRALILLPLFIAVVFLTLVSTQCSNHRNVELLVDGQVWNSNILYHLNNERLEVGCRKCNTSSGIPNWFYFNDTLVQPCDNATKVQICTQTTGLIGYLKFLPFEESLAGEYNCNTNVEINIETGKLLIVTTVCI